MSKTKSTRSWKKNKRRPRRAPQSPPRQRPDRLAGDPCPQCGGPVKVRQIDNFPVDLPGCQIGFLLQYCVYCGWNEGNIDVKSNRELSQAELDRVQTSVEKRLAADLFEYADFQEKLAGMPLDLAHTPIGAALGYGEAELSMVAQISRGIAPDVAYGELCATLAKDPLAPTVFETLTETPGGQMALLASVKYWRDAGYPPPWRDLVKGFLEK